MAYKKQTFVTVLEAGNLRSEYHCGWIPGGTSSLWQTADFLLCPHMAQGARGLGGVPLVRALIPFMRALILWPNHPQEPNLLIPSCWALGFQHTNFQKTHSNHRNHVLGFYAQGFFFWDSAMHTWRLDKGLGSPLFSELCLAPNVLTSFSVSISFPLY